MHGNAHDQIKLHSDATLMSKKRRKTSVTFSQSTGRQWLPMICMYCTFQLIYFRNFGARIRFRFGVESLLVVVHVSSPLAPIYHIDFN